MKRSSSVSVSLSLLLVGSFFLLGGCDLFGTKAPVLAPANSGQASFAYTAVAPTYLVDFSEALSGKLTLTVNGAAGKEIFLVKANPTDTEVVATGVGLAAPKVLLSAPPRAPFPDLPRAQRFNELSVAKWSAAANRSRSVSGNAPITYGTNNYNFNLGATKLFHVDSNEGKVWKQISATLRARDEHSYIWVADDNYLGSSAQLDDNKVSSQQAIELATQFEDVFTNVTTLYGYELGGGPGGNGGIDGDQHISILIYDIDFDVDSTSAGSGGTMGFFWGKDEFTQTELGTTPKTNMAEIFYLDAFFTNDMFDNMISTLAHEYTHMILYNQKNIKNNQFAPAWYNEMCAMVAEDLVVANLGYDPVTVGAQNRLPDFLSHYAVSGVTDWLAGNDVLKSYASAFAFGAFLERRYGGAEFFHSMMANSKVGQEAITEAMGSNGDFKKAFESYLTALVYTTPPVGSSVSTFNTEVSKILGSTTYVAEKIDLWNLEQLDDASTSGPFIYGNTAADQKLLRPWGFTVHRLAASATNSQSFTFTAPTTSTVQYWVMVK